MSDLFFYPREVRYMKPVENAEEGQPTEIEVTEVLYECINVKKVVRGVYTRPGELTLLMDDGHEETRVVEEGRKDKNGKDLPPLKERAWFISQVMLYGKDIERFYEQYKGV